MARRCDVDISIGTAELLNKPCFGAAGLDPFFVERRGFENDKVGGGQCPLQYRFILAYGHLDALRQIEPVGHGGEFFERRGEVLTEKIAQCLFAFGRQCASQTHFHQPKQSVFFGKNHVNVVLTHGVTPLLAFSFRPRGRL